MAAILFKDSYVLNEERSLVLRRGWSYVRGKPKAHSCVKYKHWSFLSSTFLSNQKERINELLSPVKTKYVTLNKQQEWFCPPPLPLHTVPVVFWWKLGKNSVLCICQAKSSSVTRTMKMENLEIISFNTVFNMLILSWCCRASIPPVSWLYC